MHVTRNKLLDTPQFNLQPPIQVTTVDFGVRSRHAEEFAPKSREQTKFFVLSCAGNRNRTWKNLEALYELYESTAAARRSISVHVSDYTPSWEETIEYEVGEMPMAD
jgi:hypothetical protein